MNCVDREKKGSLLPADPHQHWNDQPNWDLIAFCCVPQAIIWLHWSKPGSVGPLKAEALFGEGGSAGGVCDGNT